jgi:hypothetical protein
MEEIRVTGDTLRVIFVVLCHFMLSMREKVHILPFRMIEKNERKEKINVKTSDLNPSVICTSKSKSK